MKSLTMLHEKPGSQLSRHPTNSSTKDTLTFIELSVMRFTVKSPLARIYKVRATNAAAAAIEEELIFAA